MMNPSLKGVFAAALTPLREDQTIDLDRLPGYLQFLAQRGCHGALLLGTTGEGPSFAHHERVELMRSALSVRQVEPEFKLLAGTGTPSLEETILNTRAAFDLGLDGAVVLPPYYFRKISDEGLFSWFSQIITRAVPEGGALLGYHIPGVSGVPLSIELISRLKDTYPTRFMGIKDSSGSPEHASLLGSRFGQELVVFNGNDRLFSHALQAGAAGCITAMATLYSPDLRRVWDAHLAGAMNPQAQARLDDCRSIMDRYPPAPPLLKALLSLRHPFPRWSVRPPLLDLPIEIENLAAAELPVSSHQPGNYLYLHFDPAGAVGCLSYGPGATPNTHSYHHPDPYRHPHPQPDTNYYPDSPGDCHAASHFYPNRHADRLPHPCTQRDPDSGRTAHTDTGAPNR